jgi:hypothetical protein
VDIALRNAADVYFYIRQRGPLDAVLQGKPRIGKAGRIHNQAIEALIDGTIDAVDRFAFDVGVKDFQVVAVLLSMALQHGVKLGWRGRTIDLRLTPPQEREIGSLQQ